jgi:hypothetical protein
MLVPPPVILNLIQDLRTNCLIQLMLPVLDSGMFILVILAKRGSTAEGAIINHFFLHHSSPSIAIIIAALSRHSERGARNLITSIPVKFYLLLVSTSEIRFCTSKMLVYT